MPVSERTERVIRDTEKDRGWEGGNPTTLIHTELKFVLPLSSKHEASGGVMIINSSN